MFVDATRDPNNIRVLDFGLAKRFDGVHRILDRNGTIYTQSPEAIRGEYSEKAEMVSDEMERETKDTSSMYEMITDSHLFGYNALSPPVVHWSDGK